MVVQYPSDTTVPVVVLDFNLREEAISVVAHVRGFGQLLEVEEGKLSVVGEVCSVVARVVDKLAMSNAARASSKQDT